MPSCACGAASRFGAQPQGEMTTCTTGEVLAQFQLWMTMCGDASWAHWLQARAESEQRSYICLENECKLGGRADLSSVTMQLSTLDNYSAVLCSVSGSKNGCAGTAFGSFTVVQQ